MIPRSNPCICTKENTHDYLADRLELWIREIEYEFLRGQDNPEVLDQLLSVIDDLKTIILNLDIFTEVLPHSWNIPSVSHSQICLAVGLKLFQRCPSLKRTEFGPNSSLSKNGDLRQQFNHSMYNTPFMWHIRFSKLWAKPFQILYKAPLSRKQTLIEAQIWMSYLKAPFDSRNNAWKN